MTENILIRMKKYSVSAHTLNELPRSVKMEGFFSFRRGELRTVAEKDNNRRESANLTDAV